MADKGKINAVIYGRVSTDEQSFDSQIEDLRRYADSNGYNVVKTFGEKVSGYNQDVERFQYQAMKDYVIDNGIQHVLVWELSRLGRSTIHTLQEIEFFKNKGINIFIKKENVNTISNEPTSKMLLTMLSSIAEFERNTIVERSRRGQLSAVRAGKRNYLAQMPYGFKANDEGFIVIDKEESKVVETIFEMYLQGNSARGIATHLNSLGIPTRSTKNGKVRTVQSGQVQYIWKHNTITKMLHNPFYKGERIFKDEVIKIPSIISKKDWQQVQDYFTSNKGYQINTKYNYLLKGKIRCGHCGMTYISHTYNKTKNPNSIYKCNGGYDTGIMCKAGQFKSSVLDTNVYSLLYSSKELLETMYKESMQDFDIEKNRNQINFFRSEIESLNAKKKRLISLFKNGHIEDDEFNVESLSINNDITSNENKIKRLNKEIEDFNSIDFNDIEMFKKFVLENDFNTKREFVKKHIDNIIIHQVNKVDFDLTNFKSNAWTVNMGEHKSEPITVKYNPLDKRTKLIFVELYAFGLDTPIKALMSNIGGINYADDNLVYDNKNQSLKLKIN